MRNFLALFIMAAFFIGGPPRATVPVPKVLQNPYTSLTSLRVRFTDHCFPG